MMSDKLSNFANAYYDFRGKNSSLNYELFFMFVIRRIKGYLSSPSLYINKFRNFWAESTCPWCLVRSPLSLASSVQPFHYSSWLLLSHDVVHTTSSASSHLSSLCATLNFPTPPFVVLCLLIVLHSPFFPSLSLLSYQLILSPRPFLQYSKY